MKDLLFVFAVLVAFTGFLVLSPQIAVYLGSDIEEVR